MRGCVPVRQNPNLALEAGGMGNAPSPFELTEVIRVRDIVNATGRALIDDCVRDRCGDVLDVSTRPAPLRDALRDRNHGLRPSATRLTTGQKRCRGSRGP